MCGCGLPRALAAAAPSVVLRELRLCVAVAAAVAVAVAAVAVAVAVVVGCVLGASTRALAVVHDESAGELRRGAGGHGDGGRGWGGEVCWGLRGGGGGVHTRALTWPRVAPLSVDAAMGAAGWSLLGAGCWMWNGAVWMGPRVQPWPVSCTAMT
jgi:hypothetical protein